MKNLINIIIIALIALFVSSCATFKAAQTTNDIYEATGDGFADTSRDEAMEVGYTRALIKIGEQFQTEFETVSQSNYNQGQIGARVNDSASYTRQIRSTSDGIIRDCVVTYKKLSFIERLLHGKIYGYRTKIRVTPTNVVAYN